MAALSAKMFFLCSFIRSTHLNSEIIMLGTSHKHKNISLADTYSPAALCRRDGHPNRTLKRLGGTIKGSQVATHTLGRPGPGLPPLLTHRGRQAMLWSPPRPGELWHEENHCRKSGEQSTSPSLPFQNKPDVCRHSRRMSKCDPLKCTLWMSKTGTLKSLTRKQMPPTIYFSLDALGFSG